MSFPSRQKVNINFHCALYLRQRLRSFVHNASSRSIRKGNIERDLAYPNNAKKSFSSMIMRPSILQSSVLFRGGLYRRVWRLQYHVVRTTLIANQGCFHSKSSLEAGGVLGTKSTTETSLRPTIGWPNKYFMITSFTPNVTASQARSLLGPT